MLREVIENRSTSSADNQVLEALRQIDKDVLEQAEASYRQESKRQAEDVAVLRLNLRALKEANQNTAKSVANLKVLLTSLAPVPP